MTGNPDMIYVMNHPEWHTFNYKTREYEARVKAPDDYKEAVKRYNAYRAAHPEKFR